MKAINVSKRSRAVQALLDQAREEDVVLRADDGTRFVIHAVDDFAREIEGHRRNKKLMAYLEKCAQQTEWIPLAEVEERIGLPPRKSGKRRRT